MARARPRRAVNQCEMSATTGEKVAAGFLSLLLFATLVTVGVVGGMAYVFFSNDVSGIVPWSSG